jgi:TolA-binding protein
MQIKRHSAEVARIQAAAASERQALEQQLAAAQQQLAQLQQADSQRQQQLQQLSEAREQLQQQLEQQQAAADEQLQELQQQLGQAEAEVQQLQQELEAADLQLQQQRQYQAEVASAAVGAAAAEDADGSAGAAAGDEIASASDADDTAPSEVASDAAAATEHALRAQLGIANAEVARLRHELDVALVSVRQERQLTGQEIMRLQNELSEAAEAAASASGGASGAAAAAAAAGEPEVTSRCLQENDSSCVSWRSVHDNPAFEQQRGVPAGLAAPGAASGCAVKAAAVADDYKSGRPDVLQYETRLQDQAATIHSLQQQLKQQQQLLAALQRPVGNERRVSTHICSYCTAAKRTAHVTASFALCSCTFWCAALLNLLAPVLVPIV